jgi:hypothetical protein
MIDSIRKGVVIILSRNSHANVMECIIIKNVMWTGKSNSVVLINNTIALLLLSFSFFFLLFLLLLHLTLSSRTHTHIDWPQSKKKKKKKNSTVFSSSISNIQLDKKEYDFDIFFKFSSCVYLIISYRCLYLMTTRIIIIEFEVTTSQTKATDKEIEILVCIASR